MRRSGLFVVALLGAGCTVKDPLYCSDDHVRAAGLPYCDKDGFFPSSEHIKNTCIEQPYRLNVEVSGSGSVTSEPVGISCRGDCDEIWDNGTEVTLHAVPDGNNAFGGWVGDCSGYDPSCALTATATHSVTARFAPASTAQGRATRRFLRTPT